MAYTPLETAIRFIPMFVSGIICNLIVGFMAAHIPLVWIIGALFLHPLTLEKCSPFLVSSVGVGAIGTTTACLLFAIIDPSTTYWGYCFVGTSLSVTGADLVFTAGTLFITKFALPHEQSMFGGLFSTMTQVRYFNLKIPCHLCSLQNYPAAGYRCWCHDVNGGFPDRGFKN